MRLFNLTICFILSIAVFGQDFKSDIENIRNRYDNLKSETVEIDYNLYLDYKSDQLHSKERAIYYYTKGNVYYSIAGIDIFNFKDQQVMILHEEKMILLSNQKENKNKITKNIDFNEVLKYCDTIIPLEINSGNKKGYKIYFKPKYFTEYNNISIIFNTSNYKIEKLIFYYKQAPANHEDLVDYMPRLELIYNYVSKEPPEYLKKLNSDRFYTKSSGGLKPGNLYQGYEIIDKRTK